jgi:hypothetical protein
MPEDGTRDQITCKEIWFNSFPTEGGTVDTFRGIPTESRACARTLRMKKFVLKNISTKPRITS